MEINRNASSQAAHDLELIQQALNDNEVAYTALLNKYKESIHYAIFKIVNNKDDADDLMLETFGKAFKNLKNYSPNYAFSTWLFTIANNTAIDFIRRQKSNPLPNNNNQHNNDFEDSTQEVKTNAPNPEEDVIRKENYKLIRTLIDQLKPKYRELIIMRYYEEYSYEEIAKKLNLPVNTVKVQLHRAKQFLHNIMNESSL